MTLALIAGRGKLPGVVAAALEQPPLICSLQGFAPDGMQPDLIFRLETLGSFLLELGNRGVSEVCFCGGIDRPELDAALLDAETEPLVPILMDALSKGDDGALRAVIGLFEKVGFTVYGAHEIAPAILMSPGVPTQRQPRDSHRSDAAKGHQVLAQMGAADLGQACVIRKGRVVAQEDEAGTDAMLSGLRHPSFQPPESAVFAGEGPLPAAAVDWLVANADRALDSGAVGAVLYKAPKPGQERRADLPTIGPQTALFAAMAGLDGIIIEAGGVIVLDHARVVSILDAAHMFLWVRGSAE